MNYMDPRELERPFANRLIFANPSIFESGLFGSRFLSHNKTSSVDQRKQYGDPWSRIKDDIDLRKLKHHF